MHNHREMYQHTVYSADNMSKVLFTRAKRRLQIILYVKTKKCLEVDEYNFFIIYLTQFIQPHATKLIDARAMSDHDGAQSQMLIDKVVGRRLAYVTWIVMMTSRMRKTKTVTAVPSILEKNEWEFFQIEPLLFDISSRGCIASHVLFDSFFLCRVICGLTLNRL